MKKMSGFFLSILPLLATESVTDFHAPSSAACATIASATNTAMSVCTTDTGKTNSRKLFENTDILSVIIEYLGSTSLIHINHMTRFVSLENAAIAFSHALLEGNTCVPEDTLKVLRTAREDIVDAHGDSERKRLSNLILNRLRIPGLNCIHFSKGVYSFLSTFVQDITPEITPQIECMIDAIAGDPYVAEHMKHSVGHYYEVHSMEDEPTMVYPEGEVVPHEDTHKKVLSVGFESYLEHQIKNMAAEYLLLDDAIKPTANLTGVKYVIIPGVGETSEAIISRCDDIDNLFAGHPDLTLVVAFADDVKVIPSQIRRGHSLFPNRFCDCKYGKPSTIFSDPPLLLTKVTKLSFVGKNLEHIEAVFFNHSSIISVDFRGLINVKKIGDCFFNTNQLTSVDFSGFRNVRSIGKGFLSGASELRTVDFSSLRGVRNIENYFLSGARGLRTVDLSALRNVQSIGYYFFYEARSLNTIDFSGWRDIRVDPGVQFIRFPGPGISPCYLLTDTPNLTTIICDHQKMHDFLSKHYKGKATIQFIDSEVHTE